MATPETIAADLAAVKVEVPAMTDKDWNAKPQAGSTIYEDDKSFGKICPELDSLEYIRGDKVVVGHEGKTTVLLFWAKFAKGDYTTIVGLNRLVALFPDVQFVGVSVDAEKKDAESFVKKIGTAMAEISIDSLDVDYSLAWDSGKVVKESFRKACVTLALGASAVFVIDAKEKIVWREQFGQGYEPKKGQLAEQIRRHLAGEELLKNGPTPVVEDDSDGEDPNEGIDMGDDDYDSDLGF